MSESNEYDCLDTCNKCGETSNKYKVVSQDGGYISEASTVCKLCGHEDYWAYGFFESDPEKWNQEQPKGGDDEN